MISKILFMVQLFFISGDPKGSAVLAANFIDRPEIASGLIEICKRESRCKPIKIHAIDSWAASRVYDKQVSRGVLNPACQHKAQGWSTRGAFGLIAAYHMHYLPSIPCVPPQVFDVPLISAIVAAKKYERICLKVARNAWCPDYIKPSEEDQV